MRRHGLRRRIVQGVIGYTLVISVAVYLYGFVVNERAEHLLWDSLLTSEFDRIEERARAAPDEQWRDTETLQLMGNERGASLPAELAPLPPGVHDEITFHGKQWVVMIREVDGRKVALALDIEDLERREGFLAASVVGSMFLLVLILGVLIAWQVDRVTRPLRTLASDIGSLRPDRVGGRLELEPGASVELAVIADAINDYISRNERYVERERAFIETVSHELRTPIAVIGGAAELAAGQPSTPDTVRAQVSRIRRTTREIERLITLVLVLAKDPAKLGRSSDRVALHELLQEIVSDLSTMANAKGLSLELQSSPPCDVTAPLPVVQAAIGNLIRNAIENSDSGTIRISLEEPSTVVIEDPGHGMSPEQISAIYSQLARGGGRLQGGIGLDLISRLCEHLGWRLEIASRQGFGTTARLEFPDLEPASS